MAFIAMDTNEKYKLFKIDDSFFKCYIFKRTMSQKTTKNTPVKSNKSTISKPVASKAKVETKKLTNKSNNTTIKKKNEQVKKENQEVLLKVKEEPKLTKEELELIEKQNRAATLIQCKWRSVLAIKKLSQLKQEKNEFDEKMKKLEHEAFLQMIKYEQEKEEKRRMKKQREIEEKQKQLKRKKKFLEAAYDGNLQELKFIIKDYENELNSNDKLDSVQKRRQILNLIDCRDSNNNSALSEAAASGSSDVVLYLILNGADPNSRGAFERTPLWRSAFAGHMEATQILLQHGGDPRLYSQDGQKVYDCCTNDQLCEMIKVWDINITKRMLDQIAFTRAQFIQAQVKSLEGQKQEALGVYEKYKQEYSLVKNQLLKCNQELQRLHDEYLLNPFMYAPLIDQKEEEKVHLKTQHEELREKTAKARIAYKEMLNILKKEKKQLDNGGRKEDNDDDDENEEDLNDDENQMKINIKEIDDIVIRDFSGKLSQSKKWPLIIDQNEQATTFLRYRDTNYINCLDPKSMHYDRFRLALLGAIRFGKPFVLDLMDYDEELIESIKSICEQIQTNLFKDIIDKKILNKENYLKLIRPNDGEQYQVQNFDDSKIKNFKLIFITSNSYPYEFLLNNTFPIRIIVNT